MKEKYYSNIELLNNKALQITLRETDSTLLLRQSRPSNSTSIQNATLYPLRAHSKCMNFTNRTAISYKSIQFAMRNLQTDKKSTHSKQYPSQVCARNTSVVEIPTRQEEVIERSSSIGRHTGREKSLPSRLSVSYKFFSQAISRQAQH